MGVGSGGFCVCIYIYIFVKVFFKIILMCWIYYFNV